MPRRVKIALVQEKWHPNAEEHQRRLREKIVEAKENGAQLIILQELTLHRYFGDVTKKDNKEEHEKLMKEASEPLYTGPTSQFVSPLAKSLQVHIVASLFERDGDHHYNTAVIFNPQGDLQFVTRKQHIPHGKGYDETDYFENGFSDYPVHDLGFIKVGVPTCYDQWFPEVARIYGLKGAELVIYPTAIGSEPNYPGLDSQPAWEIVQRGHCVANGIFLAACNRVGFEGVITFYGSSMVVDPMGQIIEKAPRNSPCLLMAELDFDKIQFWRELFPLLKQRVPKSYGEIVVDHK